MTPAQIRALVIAAYDAGFAASDWGFHGEHPDDAQTQARYTEGRGSVVEKLASMVAPEINQNALLGEAAVFAALNKACAGPAGEARFAQKLGVTPQYINAITNAKTRPSDKILAALGLRRVERFQRIPVGDIRESERAAYEQHGSAGGCTVAVDGREDREFGSAA